MKQKKSIIVVILYVLLILKASLAILGETAEPIDYFTIIGLLVIGILEIIRLLINNKSK